MRDRFFRDNVIREFWPHVVPHISYELCFSKKGEVTHPNINLIPSFESITSIIQSDYHLNMPAWWVEMF
jgi:hypothetical protein